MSIALLFWILYILAIVFSLWQAPRPFNAINFGGNLLLFILVGLIGWHDFGAAIHN